MRRFGIIVHRIVTTGYNHWHDVFWRRQLIHIRNCMSSFDATQNMVCVVTCKSDEINDTL